MSKAGLDDRDWNILLNAIEEQQCVLVLGPDSARLTDSDSGHTITSGLAAALTASAPDIEDTDLLLAAQNRLYAEDKKDYLYYDVDKFFERYDGTTTDMHRHFAKLPFSLCIQTSPDRFLRNALIEEGKSPVEAYYDFSASGARVKVLGDNSGALVDCRPECPLVFNLHGHPANSESLVLSRRDTLDFLVSLPEYTSYLPSSLIRRLGSSDTRFLFVGFGFNLWYSQMLLHVLRKDAIQHRGIRRSVAVEPDSFFTEEPVTHTATFYNQEHSIDFSQMTFDELAGELAQRYSRVSAKASEGETISVASSEEMPLVFLCYNRLDEHGVQMFADALKERGVRVWWDRDNILAGDQWSAKVQHAIAQLADYFVILHSENFTRREAYSGKEIEAALDREGKFMHTKQKFIIPCHFMGARERIEALGQIDYKAVDDPAEVGPIVKSMMEDWVEHDRAAAKRLGDGRVQ